jgi:predicted aspartyl protease
VALVLSAAFLIAAPLCDAKPAKREYRRPASSQFDSLPLIRSRQNHLLVRLTINGRPAWFGVDSGAPVSALAMHRRDYFRVRGVGIDSDLPTRIQINGAYNSVGILRKMRLGSLELMDKPVVLLDLRSPSQAARLIDGEKELDGILGADVLFPTSAVLDCQRRLLFLRTDENAVGDMPGVNRRGLQAVPMEVSDGLNLYVDGSINGMPARLMVDTGSFATLLHRSFIRRMKIPTRQTAFRSAAVNLKQRGVRTAHIARFAVGHVDLAGKDVGVVDLGGLIHGRLLDGSPPVAGLLGAEILDRHNGIIDFGTRTLYLKRESGKTVEREKFPRPRAKTKIAGR